MFRDLFNPKRWYRRGNDGESQPGRSAAPVTGGEPSYQTGARSPEQSDTAFRAYSRRMLPPFSGQLQIAECGDARALSIDGENWEVQFRFAVNNRSGSQDSGAKRDKYTAVANITPAGLVRLGLPPVFDTEAVASTIDRLSARVAESPLPYPAADRFEYWLLDRSEQKPLALLYSCTSAEEIGAPMVRPAWMAMPAAQLPIDEGGKERTEYVPPVNARLESLVAERAGPSPQAAWFDRADSSDIEFPVLLIREDWEQEDHARLCRLYINRLAPRLLTLQQLALQERERLETAARENALEVDRFHRLYPKVLDQKMLNALRAEARLRRSAAPLSP